MLSNACRMKSFFILLAIAVFLTFPVVGESLTASASLDRHEADVGESLQLTIEMDGGGGDADLSGITGFDIQSAGKSSALSIVNGDVTRRTSLVYILFPRAAGTFTIPPITVRDGRDTAQTEAIAVRVTDGRSGSGVSGQHGRWPDAATGGSDGDIMMNASVSSPSAYAGQEIVYTLRFMAAVKVYNAKLQRPSFDGFSVREIGDQKNFTEVKNGRQYAVTEISFLLTPRKEGSYTIDSAAIACEVAGRRGGRRSPMDSMFDDPFFGGVRTESRRVASGPVTVRVLPLPAHAGGFSGLIGDFDISLDVQPKSLKVGDSATVTVTVTGKGNIKDAPAPAFNAPDDTFKVYPDNPVESVESGRAGTDRVGTSGKKVFKYAFVPVRDGSFDIGPFSLTVFDPARKQYAPLVAGPVRVTVSPSKGEKMEAQVPGPDGNGSSVFVPKKDVRLTGHDILWLKTGEDVTKSTPRMPLWIFLLLMAAPAVIFASAMTALHKRGERAGPGQAMKRHAESLLKDAEKASGAEMLSLLNKALVAAIFAASGKTGESITYDEAREMMLSASVDKELVERAIATLEGIDSARYGGASAAGGEAGLKADVSGVVRALCAKT
ncbi:MAG: protein BatD [Nitrospirae bacterium]|nr:protein BatD [Nitrospirota bacterium]